MTRSSRHKSSKHSSREARDYSDSEKDSSLKELKGKEDSSSVRVSKDSEKRKHDSKEIKDALGSGNGEYAEEYCSFSKRRKDRASDDGVSHRCNGSGEDERIESSTKLKGSSESSKRNWRDDIEEQRSKSEGKQRESSRKESREERKVKEGKSEVVNEKTDSKTQDLLPSFESELERRVRRRRDISSDGDKQKVDIGDINDRRRDDAANDGRLKDEKHKNEKYRDKYWEDLDGDNMNQDDKQRDDCPSKDHNTSRYDDKHLKDRKGAAETRPKKSKLQENDCDRECEYDHDRYYRHERDFEIGRDCERARDRDHDNDRNCDRYRYCNRDRDRDRDWDRERNRELERERERDRRHRNRDRDGECERERDRQRDRNPDRDRDLDHDRERDGDNDGSHLDDHSFKYKDSRGKKRSPDKCDDYTDAKYRGCKMPYSNMENKSLSFNRVESDADRERSQSRQAYVDSTVSSNRRRISPSTSSHGGTDEYRNIKQEDLKYRDSVAEQRPNTISPEEVGGFSGELEKGSKYKSIERFIKMDDGPLGEITVGRSSSSISSHTGLAERSPSSTSLDRRYMNINGTRSFDIEETGWRTSIGPRELSATEDRLSQELPLEKPLMGESAQMDLLYTDRTNQRISSSSLPPSSAFRAGVGSPSFMGSLKEDGRVNLSGCFRRNGDPSLGRGQGNVWRGTPNWSSPVPNGFIHFQHGPTHGGYPAMMSQFASPSMFTVRHPMEMNHSGIPYPIRDADRFDRHLRPLGWQNMLDGSGPPHLHGWDGNNGSFRDEPHMFGGADWVQNRHPMNGRGWESSSADTWKGENGDANMDLPSTSQEDHPMQAPLDGELAGQEGPQAQHGKNHVHNKSIETGAISSAKESFNISPKNADDETRDPPKVSSADNLAQRRCAYLSKVDISMELAGPDLYSQCMIVLGLDQTATVDKDTAIIVNLKDGGRVVSKISKTLLSPPLFPAANDSVFQRAMDHYKKQKVQMSGLRNGGTLDIISTSNGEKVEQGALCIVEETEELVLASDTALLNAPILTSDHDKPEVVSQSDFQETMEELGSTPYLATQDHNHTPEPNLKKADQDSSPKSSEETVLDLNGDRVDEMTSEVTSADADSDHSPCPNNATQGTTILPTDGDNLDDISKTKHNNSIYPAEERQVVTDATMGPQFFSEGSPKVTGVLMPGSNESESVILSRIHHSPESTH